MSDQPNKPDGSFNAVSPENNTQKSDPKPSRSNRRRKRFPHLTKEVLSFWGGIIAAIIGAVALIWSAAISTPTKLENLSLQTQLENRNTQILDLQTKLDNSNKEIDALTNQIKDLKHPLQGILARDGKAQFEWQWAGENWYGRIMMEEQGGKDVITQAQVGLLEKSLIDSTFINGQVLNMVPGTGSISIAENGVVHLEFTAKKKDRRLGTEQIVFVTGDLQPAVCYAGKTNYKYTDTGTQYPGDMILVNYITPLGDLVNYWFSSNRDQPWFERYIVDR